MNTENICQSCSMPLTDPELLGTEADNSPSSDYCRYCYKQGKFTDPDMTLENMKAHIMKRMENQDIPEDILESAVLRLPLLKRWKKKMPKDKKLF